jgi:flagellar biosynthetic protein FliR
MLALGLAAASETALGLLAGLAARWVLDAALGAGSVASLATGMGYGALLDPTTGAEATGPSELLFATAQALAVALGIHREAVAWLARSTVLWPPGGALDLSSLALRAVGQDTFSVALAVRLAFPVLAAVILGHAVMALASRLAPQLSLSNVGFSVAVLAGGLAFYLAAPAMAELAAGAALSAFPR